MTRSEALKIRSIIEKAVISLSDEDALNAPMFYPSWKVGEAYTTGFRIKHNDVLYRVIQDHTSQADWKPDTTPSLYTRVDETHTGTVDNPIPYEGNMVLEYGKYYTENEIIYLCTRDTVNPVYSPLVDLIGIYIEEVIT